MQVPNKRGGHGMTQFHERSLGSGVRAGTGLTPMGPSPCANATQHPGSAAAGKASTNSNPLGATISCHPREREEPPVSVHLRPQGPPGLGLRPFSARSPAVRPKSILLAVRPPAATSALPSYPPQHAQPTGTAAIPDVAHAPSPCHPATASYASALRRHQHVRLQTLHKPVSCTHTPRANTQAYLVHIPVNTHKCSPCLPPARPAPGAPRSRPASAPSAGRTPAAWRPSRGGRRGSPVGKGNTRNKKLADSNLVVYLHGNRGRERRRGSPLQGGRR